MADSLSPKHRLFVEAYCGDLTQAMQVAGYIGQPAQLEARGRELLANPSVKEAIRQRAKYLVKTQETIATREERQEFLSAVMRNQDPHRIPELDEFGKAKAAEPVPMNTRLKALELLGKSHGDFTENINVSGNITVTDIISKSYQIPDDDLDAIEAEYEEIRSLEKKATEQEEEVNEEETNDSSSVGGHGGSDLPDEEPHAEGHRDISSLI